MVKSLVSKRLKVLGVTLHGNAEDRYSPSKQIRFKASILRSDLCDFSDAYIVVKRTITVTNPDNNAYDK